MSVVVFAGPTIDAATVRSTLDADVRGPVSFGDVFRAAQRHPTAIAIIDGYFDRVAAVWHKEILWAMSEGIRVFGSSSMGALRAAELADFGMEGIGDIFESYRSGELEDDDEVAVAHGPADSGFAMASEAMVNLRATLRAAVALGVITSKSCALLERLAKARFYAERSYAALFEDGVASAIDRTQLAALKQWLPTGRVDQKRADALRLLEYVRRWAGEGHPPMQARYRFHATDAWHQAMRLAATQSERADGASTPDLASVVEELKVSGDYPIAWSGAALRGAAVEECSRAGIRPDFLAVRGAVEHLRGELGLLDQPAVDQWRLQQRMGETEAVRFFESEARAAWARPILDEFARRHLVDHLRATGDYGRLVARADAKRRHLDSRGSATPCLEELSITESALWDWYFLNRLRRPVPSDVHAYARRMGFRDGDELRSSAIREHMFVHRPESVPVSMSSTGIQTNSLLDTPALR